MEAQPLIENNLSKISEMSWEKNIISLIHSKNYHNNRIKPGTESNGCHFGFSDRLFDFIITLDKNKMLENKFKNKDKEN